MKVVLKKIHGRGLTWYHVDEFLTKFLPWSLSDCLVKILALFGSSAKRGDCPTNVCLLGQPQGVYCFLFFECSSPVRMWGRSFFVICQNFHFWKTGWIISLVSPRIARDNQVFFLLSAQNRASSFLSIKEGKTDPPTHYYSHNSTITTTTILTCLSFQPNQGLLSFYFVPCTELSTAFSGIYGLWPRVRFLQVGE